VSRIVAHLRGTRVDAGYIQPETGYFTNAFDFCKAKCRTNSKSTVHENAYKSRQHFCYGDEPGSGAVDAGASVAGKVAMGSVDVQTGEAGESCDQVCRRHSKACAPSGFDLINECSRMKQAFPVRAPAERDGCSLRGVCAPAERDGCSLRGVCAPAERDGCSLRGVCAPAERDGCSLRGVCAPAPRESSARLRARLSLGMASSP
jgi:hypothetical protein